MVSARGDEAHRVRFPMRLPLETTRPSQGTSEYPTTWPRLLMDRAKLVAPPGSVPRSVGALVGVAQTTAWETPLPFVAKPALAPLALIPKPMLSTPPSVCRRTIPVEELQKK